MNWNGNFEQLHMCPVIQTSVKMGGADARHNFNELMLGAYGIEYKSYSPASRSIPLS